MIQVFSPTLGQEELKQVAESFYSGWIGKCEKVTEFEVAWAAHIGVDPAHVVSTNSCTEALFAAVNLLGIGPGDEVVIPTIHFVGAAQAVLAVGARPVFCDVDERTLNTTSEFLIDKTTKRTRAIILNHYGGVACEELQDIKQCRESGIFLIEDAACAPASTSWGQAVGTFGDIGCWSFDAMKILSTGDGGMMYIRNSELAEKARKLLYLGVTPTGLDGNDNKWWEYETLIPGARRGITNDIAAGIGLEQLKKLRGYIKRRFQLSMTYHHELPEGIFCKSFGDYFYWIQTDRRDELAHYLRENQIYTTFRYWPLHLAYKTSDSLPNAEKAAQETLLLPLHQGLSDEQVGYICEKVKDFFG